MGLMLGECAPDFTAVTTTGTIHFYDWLGSSWGMLFSHPADRTPVCTTEIGALAKLEAHFKKRDVKVIGLSVDSLTSHQEWIAEINTAMRVTVEFPIIADPDRTVADQYGMLYSAGLGSHQNATIRSVFIIDPNRIVRLSINYPETTGRNFYEILRAIDSLQITDRHHVATPANWKPGDDCIVPPDVSREQLQARCPEGWIEVTPYLRYTPCPNHARRA